MCSIMAHLPQRHKNTLTWHFQIWQWYMYGPLHFGSRNPQHFSRGWSQPPADWPQQPCLFPAPHVWPDQLKIPKLHQNQIPDLKFGEKYQWKQIQLPKDAVEIDIRLIWELWLTVLFSLLLSFISETSSSLGIQLFKTRRMANISLTGKRKRN